MGKEGKQEDVDQLRAEYFAGLKREYENECYSLNKASGCNQLGEFIMQMEKDFPTAAKHFRRGCEKFSQGTGKPCFNLGSLYMAGNGVERNEKRAYEYFKQGCDKNDMDACNNVGMGLWKGRGVDKNVEEAIKFFELGCRKKYALSCFNLSILYLVADGVPKDMPKAVQYSEKACDLGFVAGCVNAHVAYKNGDGVEKNAEKAAELKKIAEEIHASS
eukprot:Nk52_evm20s1992 gene=Nk52_evmTU20s1992